MNVLQITCPGVLLKDKEQLYLSVSVLGQCKKTQCVPAAFPLLFHEKLVFEKVRSQYEPNKTHPKLHKNSLQSP